MNNKPPFATHLASRSVLRVSGADRHAFLQGLISNDIAKATKTTAIYAALLTPQGKFLHDLFIVEQDDAFLIDCEAERAEDLMTRLAAYKLRAKVSSENKHNAFDIWAVWDGGITAPLAFADPRLSQMGQRFFTAKGAAPDATRTDFAAYDAHRLALGIADGSRDLEIGKSTLAEGNFDYLHGIDWKKGCYVGQELTARMNYRGLVKKRLFPVRIEGDVAGQTAVVSNGAEIGQLRSHRDTTGLALLPVENIDQQTPLNCGNATLFPFRPDWMPRV